MPDQNTSSADQSDAVTVNALLTAIVRSHTVEDPKVAEDQAFEIIANLPEGVIGTSDAATTAAIAAVTAILQTPAVIDPFGAENVVAAVIAVFDQTLDHNDHFAVGNAVLNAVNSASSVTGIQEAVDAITAILAAVAPTASYENNAVAEAVVGGPVVEPEAAPVEQKTSNNIDPPPVGDAAETPPVAETAAPTAVSQGVNDNTADKTPEPEVTIDPPATASTKVVTIVGNETPAVLGNAIIEPVLAEVGTMAKVLLQQVAEYMDQMRPRREVNAVEGARIQAGFYRTILMIFNRLEGDEFTKVFTTLLKLFEEHRNGVFHETHAFRFMEHIALAEQDRKAFPRILNMLKVTAPLNGRGTALKQINFKDTLSHGVEEAARQRIMNFFNL